MTQEQLAHKSTRLTKHVDLIAKDADEQVAVGIVMVPDKVDHQGDFVRDDTIATLAETFETLLETEQADGGIMHAVWPSEWMELESNRVLESADEIAGQTVDAGAWVQEWAFNDADLWQLVRDGVLAGYSIGAVDVEWSPPMGPDELPDDVAVAEAYDDDGPFWELRRGIIREVSTVDIPAVPDALILEAKADAAKALAHHLGDHEAFIEEAIGRGHGEDEAQRLWDVLNRAIEIEGATSPGKSDDGMLARVGRAAVNALTGGEKDAELPAPTETAKESRTLSAANERALMAAFDAIVDVFDDAGTDVDATPFSTRDDVDFDLESFAPREWTLDEEPIPEHDPGNVTPDGDTQMSDDTPDDTGSDDLETRVDELIERVGDLEDETKNDDGAAELREKLDELEVKLDALAEASGKSQQLDGEVTENDGPTKADILGLPGGGG